MTDLPSISFAGLETPPEGVLAVLAEEGSGFAPLARAIDEKSGGQLTRASEASKYKGKRNSVLEIFAPFESGPSRVLSVGVGKTGSFGEDDWVNAGGSVRGALDGRDGADLFIAVETNNGVTAEQVADFTLGLMLRGYRFNKYKSNNKKKDEDEDQEQTVTSMTVLCPDPGAAEKAFAARRALAWGVIRARDLVNEPGNILGPKEFAEQTQSLSELGVDVEVLDEAALAKLGMGALLAVGKGSVQPSYLVVMRWSGADDKSADPVVFVGKGVTFDAGGISLKPSAGMEDMKGDMAGAACVVGLMHALAARSAKVDAIGIIGLVENMPSGSATRPGDIVTAMSGTTIEVLNTDAEGRMVLADALWYAQERFKPQFVINLATLTGAIMVALGKEHAGLFSNNDELARRLTEAGIETGEKVWRLPLGKKYDKLIDSKVADIKNTGGRWGGAITAAQFLQRFVKDETPWAHLDIAGTGLASSDSDISRSWGSGFGVRLLDRLVADYYEPKSG